MIDLPDFNITSAGPVSGKFIGLDLLNFKRAAQYIQGLPYRRNANKNDLLSIFTDNCGTCSTKHALLKQLADENGFEGLRLMVGLFKLNSKNTPAITQTLHSNGLHYIPEAHCYLKYKSLILDFTKENFELCLFSNDFIEELEISPNQINDYKVAYHKNYLASWLIDHPPVRYTPEQIWSIREQCIRALSIN